MSLVYQHGFHHDLATEAIPGTLPKAQNSPQRLALGLYAEQLSLTAFTVARANNRRSWLYRKLPSVAHHVGAGMGIHPQSYPTWLTGALTQEPMPPVPLRWDPFPLAHGAVNWLDGLYTYVVTGNAELNQGGAVHLYACNRSMEKQALQNADGDLLILPETGELLIETELGRLAIAPGFMAMIPRGVMMSVKMISETARGYVIENYGQPWQLPELGVLGANGLANPYDFEAPVAWVDDAVGDFQLTLKTHGRFWQKTLKTSPFNVVAWRGNAYPYRYDLSKFNTIGSISYDHPDPSIFTVLTSPSAHPGIANLDFVIFPPRWLVAEHTFRPPYFHRNIMSEFMGLIEGQYDAKPEGFMPGGASLHNRFVDHGPDMNAYQRASTQSLQPEYLANTLAFMAESSLPWHTTIQALDAKWLQHDYHTCWQGF